MNKSKFNVLHVFCFSIFSFLVSCQSCQKPTSDSLLKHDYNVVMGVLAPDSANEFERNYPTEVFVGKMIPTNLDNIFYVQGTKDSVLWELMSCARQHFINYFEYDSLAEVRILSNGQNVKLTYTGFGVYRDLVNELKIKPLERYTLNVAKADGRIFTSETTVPGNVKITNIDIDTMSEVPGHLMNEFTITFKALSNGDQFYYVSRDRRNNFESEIIGYSFADSVVAGYTFTKSGLDTSRIDYINDRFELRAVNRSYALFHTPCGGEGRTPDFVPFEKSLYDMEIEERSNIGGKDVAGVFGSYNATVKFVVFKALWNQAGKTGLK